MRFLESADISTGIPAAFVGSIVEDYGNIIANQFTLDYFCNTDLEFPVWKGGQRVYIDENTLRLMKGVDHIFFREDGLRGHGFLNSRASQEFHPDLRSYKYTLVGAKNF